MCCNPDKLQAIERNLALVRTGTFLPMPCFQVRVQPLLGIEVRVVVMEPRAFPALLKEAAMVKSPHSSTDFFMALFAHSA